MASRFSLAAKLYSIFALFAVLVAAITALSDYNTRQNAELTEAVSIASRAALNVERINSLVYAVVMESRGIYMSADRGATKQFADGLMRRNGELAEAVKSLERTVGDDDAEQLATFRQRIVQFIEFRRELVRRGLEISPAAAREWGDNDANRTVRRKLNSDVEALERIYQQRAREADALANENRYAAAYLFALGLAALILAGLNVVVMRGSVVGALAEITQATDRIAQGEALEVGEEPAGLTPQQLRAVNDAARARVRELMAARAADIPAGDETLAHVVESIHEVEGKAAAPGVRFACAGGFVDPTGSAPYDGEQKAAIQALIGSDAARREVQALLGCAP